MLIRLHVLFVCFFSLVSSSTVTAQVNPPTPSTQIQVPAKIIFETVPFYSVPPNPVTRYKKWSIQNNQTVDSIEQLFASVSVPPLQFTTEFLSFTKNGAFINSDSIVQLEGHALVGGYLVNNPNCPPAPGYSANAGHVYTLYRNNGPETARTWLGDLFYCFGNTEYVLTMVPNTQHPLAGQTIQLW